MKSRSKEEAMPILVLIVLCLLLSGCGLAKEVKIAHTRHDKWINDIDFLSGELPKRHKNLFFSLDSADFYSEVEHMKEHVDEWTDEELMVAISSLVASVGDGHTMVYPDFSVMYPIRLYWFKEGLYAIDASEEYQEIINLRLSTVNGHPVDEVLNAFRPMISRDNEAGFKYYATSYMLLPWALQGLGISDGSGVKLGFTDDRGLETSITVHPEAAQNIGYVERFKEVAELPLYLRNPGLFYWYEYIPEHRTVYFQYNVCANMQGRSFDEFADELFDFIDKNEVEKLIVDLRNNGGGNSLVMSPFLNKIRRSDLNKANKLFAIIGRRTFSSALLNALDLKGSTQATLVGEATGGKPNHYGEVKTLFLANTGLTVGYSTKHFKHSQEDTDSLYPDVFIEPSIVAFTGGHDPVVDWILQQ